jgi:CHAT domain-containing protein
VFIRWTFGALDDYDEVFPYADFTFLSACPTTGDEMLSDEAVHMVAGLMLTGYQSVIAPMWAFMDKDAPVIVDRVYSELFSNTEPDNTKAALALHRAVKVLRQWDSAFLFWMPFIHVGV